MWAAAMSAALVIMIKPSVTAGRESGYVMLDARTGGVCVVIMWLDITLERYLWDFSGRAQSPSDIADIL
jgi:hypothetical protein